MVNDFNFRRADKIPTNDYSGLQGGTPPAGMAPTGPAPGSIEWFRNAGAPDVQPQTNPLSNVPARFVKQGNVAATPPAAANPNAAPLPAANPAAPPLLNPSGGTMTLTGNPGAAATISPTGALTENAGWRAATAPGTATGQGQIPGVGGTLNVISSSPHFATPQDSSAAGTGEVWAGSQGQLLRDRLTQNMNLAMQKANAPYTAERGTAEETGGNRQQWANLAHQFGETLSGGITAQGVERGVAAGHANTGALLPSEIAKNQGITEYYGSHGEAQLQNAAAKEEMAKNQLEIAGLKANAGKYGDTATASEYLKGAGFAPNPQAIDAFNKGWTTVPGSKETKTGIPGFRTVNPAVKAHMIGPGWKPVMEDGKQKIVNGEPIYTDAQGEQVKPSVYGK